MISEFEALQESIKTWEEHLREFKERGGDSTPGSCALCDWTSGEYKSQYGVASAASWQLCRVCPIARFDKRESCKGTPFYQIRDVPMSHEERIVEIEKMIAHLYAVKKWRFRK